MIQIREFDPTQDSPALQTAINGAVFHPGAWTLAHFLPDTSTKACAVITDGDGPIVYTRYTKVLRIGCVWNDEADYSRNAKAVIFGIKDAVTRARASGFNEIQIQTDNEPLKKFLTKVPGMRESHGEFLLQV